ncbi:MAG: pyridoxal 5'-phosphate synthase glutaminase subunit PdxT [Candidatus Hadarchaeales archaeon]
MRVGVIGLQGAVTEHLEATAQAMKSLGISGEALWIDSPKTLKDCDGIIIPGGESTTIGKLMVRTGLFDIVKEMGKEGVPILGTCAGLILLAKKGDIQVERTKQPLLGLMDIEVQRNAFGRQRESFEADLDLSSIGIPRFRGVFIRAPAIRSLWGGAKPVAFFQGRTVGAIQNNILALSFHPELAGDTGVHEFFLKMCMGRK